MKDTILERHRREARKLSSTMPIYQLCPGCGVEVLGGGYCPDCRNEGAKLDDLYAHARRASDRREAPGLERAAKGWRRFEGLFYCVLFCGLSGYLGWKLAPWFIELFRMWFGGN